MKKFFILLILFTSFNSFSQSQSEINQSLTKMADEINQTLPMNIDEYTVLVNMYAGFGKVIYNYQVDESLFEDLNMKLSEWRTSQTKVLNNSWCTNPVFDFFKNNNVSVAWNYSSNEGVFLHNIALDKNDCN